MPTSGPNHATVISFSDDNPNLSWTNYTNAITDDDNVASQNLSGPDPDQADPLIAQDCGTFTGVADSDTITNVKVEIKCRHLNTDGVGWYIDIQLLIGNVVSGNVQNLAAFSNTLEYQTAEAPTDNTGWNVSLTGADLDAGFGVQLKCIFPGLEDPGEFGDNDTVEIDAVRITVTYQGQAFTLTADAGTFDETGNSATLLEAHKLASTVGSIVETGRTANLNTGHRATAVVGPFTETGGTASLLHSYPLRATTALFVEAGNNAGLISTRFLSCSTGVLGVTGNSTNLLHSYPLVAVAAPFAETGSTAGLTATRSLNCSKGSFAVTGRNANMLHGFAVGSDTGLFVDTANNANLTTTRTVSVDVGSFTEIGKAANLLHGFAIICSCGAFTEIGNEADLVYTPVALNSYSLTGNQGVFLATGQSATLRYIPSAPTAPAVGGGLGTSGAKYAPPSPFPHILPKRGPKSKREQLWEEDNEILVMLEN